jgi:hypothetical protein
MPAAAWKRAFVVPACHQVRQAWRLRALAAVEPRNAFGDRCAGEILGHLNALLAIQGLTLQPHHAGSQRIDDRIGIEQP